MYLWSANPYRTAHFFYFITIHLLYFIPLKESPFFVFYFQLYVFWTSQADFFFLMPNMNTYNNFQPFHRRYNFFITAELTRLTAQQERITIYFTEIPARESMKIFVNFFNSRVMFFKAMTKGNRCYLWSGKM